MELQIDKHVVGKNPHLNVLGEEIKQTLLEKHLFQGRTREIQFLTLQKTN